MINLIGAAMFLCLFYFCGCTDTRAKDYFSGEIEYAYTYESDLLDLDSLKSLRPARGIFRYDSRDYQSMLFGKDTLTFFYSGRLKKCVAETNSQKDYSCENYAISNDSVLSYKLYDSEEKILGRDCRILEMQKRNSWVRYHVSRDLQIAPATYLGHKAYNWDIYGKRTGGGLILGVEHRFKNFTLKGRALQLKPRNKEFKALTIDESTLDKICTLKH